MSKSFFTVKGNINKTEETFACNAVFKNKHTFLRFFKTYFKECVQFLQFCISKIHVFPLLPPLLHNSISLGRFVHNPVMLKKAGKFCTLFSERTCSPILDDFCALLPGLSNWLLGGKSNMLKFWAGNEAKDDRGFCCVSVDPRDPLVELLHLARRKGNCEQHILL